MKHRTLIALALTLASGWAAAHSGHGPTGAHLHPGETLGLLLALGLAGAGLSWWRGRGR